VDATFRVYVIASDRAHVMVDSTLDKNWRKHTYTHSQARACTHNVMARHDYTHG